ncbi:MAG TPA: hypothetical protein VLC09_10615 [Polyangiaceae bacterium]|nr:hypothetical protein [Polyangiaceae bacterium]
MTKVLLTSLTTLTLAAAAVGCVPEFDDNLSLVSGRRVLAVRSVPAEAKPGEEVEFTVLIATSEGAAEDADSLTWDFCTSPKPLTELGPVAQVCVDEFGGSSKYLTAIGRGPTVQAALPADGCRNFGPIGPSAGEEGVTGRPADPDATGGYYQPVVFGDDVVNLASPRISCGLDRFPSQPTIEFNAGYRPNENPEIAALHFTANGNEGELLPGTDASLTVAPGTAVDLRLEWAACPREAECGDGLCTAGESPASCREDCEIDPRGCTGAETYLAGDRSTSQLVERREGMTAAWYTTSGLFGAEQTARLEQDADGTDTSNGWTAPDEAGEVRLWLVLRDDRGGVGWNEYRIRVESP